MMFQLRLFWFSYIASTAVAGHELFERERDVMRKHKVQQQSEEKVSAMLSTTMNRAAEKGKSGAASKVFRRRASISALGRAKKRHQKLGVSSRLVHRKAMAQVPRWTRWLNPIRDVNVIKKRMGGLSEAGLAGVENEIEEGIVDDLIWVFQKEISPAANVACFWFGVTETILIWEVIYLFTATFGDLFTPTKR